MRVFFLKMSDTSVEVNDLERITGESEVNGKVTTSGSEFLPSLYADLKKLSGNKINSEGENHVNFCSRVKETYGKIFKFQEEFEKRKLFKDEEELWSQWLNVVGTEMTDAERDSKENHLENLKALAFNNRGYMKYLQVDFEGAICDYSESLKFNPALACAFYNRGLVYYRLAFFGQSYDDMRKAVSLEPENQAFVEGLERVKEMVGSPKGHNFKLE